MRKHAVYGNKLLVLSNLTFWTVVGIVSISESVFFYTLREQEVPWITILIWDLNWLMWLFASLPIVHLVRVLVKIKKSWNQFVWRMAFITLVLSFVLIFIECVLNYSVKAIRSDEAVFSEILLLLLTYKVHVNVIIICTLTGITVALNAYNESKTHELRSKELEAKTEELKRQLSDAQLDALKRQLRPHFLFNSMHLISGLILKKEYEMAMKMITRLSDLLRQTLKYDRHQWIPLEEEIELVQLYLEIHQVRFGSGLELDIRVAPDAEQAKVPTFILQPIVENSLVHGIEPNKNKGEVKIDCFIKNNALSITVSDNGKGNNSKTKIDERIGIQNTRSRLTTLFGDDFTFQYESLDPIGFSTRMVLPILNPEWYEEAR